MEKLIQEQQALDNKISNSFTNLMKKGKKKVTLGDVASRLQSLKENYEKYQQNHQKIMEIKKDEDDQLEYFSSNLFDEVEEKFLDARAQFFDIKAEKSTPSTSTQNANLATPTVVAATPAINRKMPTINIPKFDGKHSSWISYRDLFKALVVDQPISNIEKLSHLRDSLSDEPLIMIKNLSVSEENFVIAWNKLLTYYNNNKNIIYTHVQELLNIKSMTSENAGELRRLLNGTTDAVDSLEALGGPINH